MSNEHTRPFACGRCGECDGGRGPQYCVSPRGGCRCAECRPTVGHTIDSLNAEREHYRERAVKAEARVAELEGQLETAPVAFDALLTEVVAGRARVAELEAERDEAFNDGIEAAALVLNRIQPDGPKDAARVRRLKKVKP